MLYNEQAGPTPTPTPTPNLISSTRLGAVSGRGNKKEVSKLVGTDSLYATLHRRFVVPPTDEHNLSKGHKETTPGM